jgi:serine/threonine-protein kinase
MGEVYRARDPRMGREVAIKISAQRYTDRFEREVRAVAALNHTNICQVYDVGPSYLVMELVEGPTLAQRIKTGALPPEEALPIARQIADALEAAHERGIIHRDLKPANVKIKPDGTVKVLDFGLAKMAEQTAAAGSPEESPTVTMGATVAGQVMGTAAYMAPEQARGKTVDKRADIWAFGVVLYEMLTGRRLFQGETISDTLAGVLTKEPIWNGVPTNAQRLLKSCLEKEPKRRLRDIGDAWRLLDDAPVPVSAGSRLSWAVTGALALALTLAVGLWAPWRESKHAIEQFSVRLDFDLGSNVSLRSSTGPAVILSPDGKRLVFVSQTADGTNRLFRRQLDQPAAAEIPGTNGASTPFFSPDGQWVGFFAQGKLKKIQIDGGQPVSLCDAPSSRGASWGENGYIVAALDPQKALSTISSEGGNVVALTELAVGEQSHRWPQVLPGSKAVLFTLSTEVGNFDRAGIAAVDLSNKQKKTILEHAGMYPRYLPSGHLVYASKGKLFAVPFDLDRLEVRGAPVAWHDISSNTNIGSAQLDFSRTGILAYRSGRTEDLKTIQWLDAEGDTTPLWNEAGSYMTPRFSPDGTRLVVQVNQESGANIWTYDWRRGSKTRLTDGIVASNPTWSSDGRFVVFRSAAGMSWVTADGAGTVHLLTESRALQVPIVFTPDGSRLVYSEMTPGAEPQIRSVALDGKSSELRAGKSESFVKTSSFTVFAGFSPDGKWLAYMDSPGGIYEVYVRAFPGAGGAGTQRWQVSNSGGTMPVWSGNGHELFYRTEDQRIMVVSYTVKGEAFIAEKPRLWAAKKLANVGLSGNLDLAPDGKRFLVLVPVESPEPRESESHITLVVNFFDEVRRRLAAGK